jgi:hypothetical protein
MRLSALAALRRDREQVFIPTVHEKDTISETLPLHKFIFLYFCLNMIVKSPQNCVLNLAQSVVLSEDHCHFYV